MKRSCSSIRSRASRARRTSPLASSTLIEDQAGTISQVLEWGMRELAYPDREAAPRASTCCSSIASASQALREIERNIKLMDPVLRFISVQQAENAPPATLRQQRPTEAERRRGRRGADRLRGRESGRAPRWPCEENVGGGRGPPRRRGIGRRKVCRFCADKSMLDRLQGRAHARDVPQRARQDHSGAHHRQLRPPPAPPDRGDQAGPDGGPAAVHDRLP